MLLALDVGNTNTVVGLYRDARLEASWRLSTDRDRTADEFAVLLGNLLGFAGLKLHEIDGVVFGCVVPQLVFAIETMCRDYLRVAPLAVGPGIKMGMSIRYDSPREVGADRVVNAVAAYRRYGGPLIVVDFGTATTFDAVSADGEYLGGAIAPGIVISAEALFHHAAKLTRVELVQPPAAIGKNTVASTQSGIVFGYAGMVDGLVDRIRTELGGTARVVATGGLAELVAGVSRTIECVDQMLTLEGLRIIYELNQVRPPRDGSPGA